MPPPSFSNLFTRFLMGSKGLSAANQTLLKSLIQEVPIIRRELIDTFKDPSSVPDFSKAPALADFPKLKSFRDIIKEIEAISPPVPGLFDGIVVKASDYAQQGTFRRIDESGVHEISVEEALNSIMSGSSKLNTGSNNTLEKAIANASSFRETMGFENMLHEYLAMDMSWWPSSEASILSLIVKNMMVEAAVIPVQSSINEAVRFNPGIDFVMDTSHSYAQAARSLALSQFEPRSVIDVRSAFFAPLGRPEAMTSLILNKNSFAGEVSIIRPDFDPLEELATGYSEVFLDATFDVLVTDLRVGVGSHKLLEITKKLKAKMEADGTSYRELIDQHYTERPGTVSYHTSVSGEQEREITTRSGEKYSNEAWLKQYDKLLDAKAQSLGELMKGQMKQLEELVKVTGPTTEIESTATTLKDANDLLQSTDTDGLYDAVSSVEIDTNGISETILKLTKNAESKMRTDQKESIDEIIKQNETITEDLEKASEEIDELSEGLYEPEEIIE